MQYIIFLLFEKSKSDLKMFFEDGFRIFIKKMPLFEKLKLKEFREAKNL